MKITNNHRKSPNVTSLPNDAVFFAIMDDVGRMTSAMSSSLKKRPWMSLLLLVVTFSLSAAVSFVTILMRAVGPVRSGRSLILWRRFWGFENFPACVWSA